MAGTGLHGAGRRWASAVRSRHLAAACAAVIASVTFGINMRDANPDRQYATAVARTAIVTGVDGASRANAGSDLANYAQSGARRAVAEVAGNAPVPRTPSNSFSALGLAQDAAVGAIGEVANAGTPLEVNRPTTYLIHAAAQRARDLREHPLKGWWPVIALSLLMGALVPLWLMTGAVARRYR